MTAHPVLARAATAALDPSVADSIVARIAEDEDVDRATAERWFAGTLQFLEVAARMPRPSVPSPAVDAGWHAFILHTRAYKDYCEGQLGRYLHHDPTPPSVKADPDSWLDAQLDYAATRLAAEQRFGDLDPEVWPAP